MATQRVETLVVDCEQCLREEQVTAPAPTARLPEGWIEVAEGPPFNERFQFCSSECFVAWHARDKYERLESWNERMRELRAANLSPGLPS